MSQRGRIIGVGLLAVIAAGVAGGCEFKGDQVNGGEGIAAEAWPWVPVGVRVHPFTTITQAEGDGALTLEARIELIDRVNDVTKGVGDLRFELYAEAVTAQRAGQEQRLMLWEAPIQTVEQTQRHWDPITRTYIFRLKLTDPLPRDRKLRLDVQLTDPWDRRMTGRAPVSAPSDKPE